MNSMEKFLDLLEEANNDLKVADHMIYVTFPLLKERRLLVKILDEINCSLLKIINAILQYENFQKRIVLHKDSKINFQTFREKCAERFGISQQEINKVVEIFMLIEKHKASPMEFVKKEKFVIMSSNLDTNTLTLEQLKEFLITTKRIFRLVELKINPTNRESAKLYR